MFEGIRPVSEWPLLLVGPMLRRVTREQVHVFIATSKPVTPVELLVYRGRVRAASSTNIATGNVWPLHKIGERLYVGLLRANLPGISTSDDLFSYDIRLAAAAGDDRSAQGLRELGLLGTSTDPLLAAVPLGYATGYLPNFRLPPPDREDLRLAHASCRKPHGGEGEVPDALQILDAVVLESLGALPGRPDEYPASNTERPHQLILTGDQIYADDVAAGLLEACTQAGELLLGRLEAIPGLMALTQFIVEPGWRTRFLTIPGIKDIPPEGNTDYPASHLLRFGEWCAMYIFAWSDALWVA